MPDSPQKRSPSPKQHADRPVTKRHASFTMDQPQRPVATSSSTSPRQVSPARSPVAASGPVARSPTLPAVDTPQAKQSPEEQSSNIPSIGQLSSGSRPAFASFAKPMGVGTFGASATSKSMSFGSFARAAPQQPPGVSIFSKVSGTSSNGDSSTSKTKANGDNDNDGLPTQNCTDTVEDGDSTNNDSRSYEKESGNNNDVTAFGTPIKHLEQVPVETGEEEDEMRYTVRARLYALEEDEYRERGIGALKVNVREQNGKRHARLVMRAEAIHRLLLNVALFPGMKVDITGDRYVRFVVFEGDKLVTFLAKVSKSTVANELASEIRSLIPAQDTKSPKTKITRNPSLQKADPALPPDTPKVK